MVVVRSHRGDAAYIHRGNIYKRHSQLDGQPYYFLHLLIIFLYSHEIEHDRDFLLPANRYQLLCCFQKETIIAFQPDGLVSFADTIDGNLDSIEKRCKALHVLFCSRYMCVGRDKGLNPFVPALDILQDLFQFFFGLLQVGQGLVLLV